MNTIIKLKLSAQRALLFNVIDALELFFVSITDGKLNAEIFCNRDLSDDEKEIYYAVVGEIEGDFIEVKKRETRFYLKSDFNNEFEKSGQLVFAKYE